MFLRKPPKRAVSPKADDNTNGNAPDPVSPVSKAGILDVTNATFVKNIYSVIEKEFEVKKRYCKLFHQILLFHFYSKSRLDGQEHTGKTIIIRSKYFFVITDVIIFELEFQITRQKLGN